MPESHPLASSKPSWLAKLGRAKAAAMAEMTDEERGQLAEATRQSRERAEARKAARLERLRLIFELAGSGHTAAEIGRVIGIAPNRVRNFAASRGVFISRSETVVKFRVPMTVAGREALRRVAERQGVASAEMLQALAAIWLDDEAAIGRMIVRNPDLARRALKAAFVAGNVSSAPAATAP